MEKRAFTRRKVRLEGVCVAPGLGRREVEIRDFCSGGMLLACDSEAGERPFYTPSQGEMVEIRCDIPLDEGTAPLLFRGRIVRVEGETAGLAFIDPDLLSLQRLQAFAKAPPLERTKAQATAAPLTGDVPVGTLAEGFRSIARASIEPLLKDFIEKTVDQLYFKAGAVDTIAEKNAFYDALSTLDKRGTAFKQSFTANMSARLSGVVAPAQFGRDLRDTRELSLVQEDVFEEWLAFSDTTRKSEVEHQQLLTDLGFRLEPILDRAVTIEDNPVGPGSFTHAFKETLQQFSLHPNAARVAYTVFRDVLVVHLRKLYETLNQFFIEHGVLPDLRYKYRVRRGGDRPAKQAAEPDLVAHSAAAPAGLDKAVAAPPGQDWYRLVQDLANLQHVVPPADATQLERQADASAGLPAPAPRHYYAPEDLDAALSRIKPASPEVRDRSHESIKLQLMTTLAKNNPEHGDVRIGAREETILDVADNLIDSALNDKLVSTNVTPWLKKLSVPLVKTALRDESVFSDRSHWARQVVNAVAQLEFYGGEGDAGHNAVAQRIDNVLTDIASAESASPEIFKRALRELNALIRIQHKAYLENVKEVLADERRANAGGTRAKAAPPIPKDSRLLEWYQRLRRLKIGHSILFDPDGEPRRLRLAWVSKDLDRYVFVNVKGLKELAVAREDLVQRLYDGSALVLDDGGEPLMDRAQYTMLQKMHRNLLHETTHDHLTGLANRREFERMLTDAIHQVQQGEGRFVVWQLDLTQFNVVNSTFGYDSGDRVLVDITELLRKELENQGRLARIGGDEFALLLDQDVEQALALSGRVKEAIQHYRFTSDNKTLAISFSAGLAPVRPETVSATELLQATESASQIARGKGINYTQVFNAEDSGVHRQHEVAQWVARIDTALDSENLDLRYQPIVGIENNGLSVHHSEILLGVLDEQGKPISPTEFILAAERFRRMTAVDRWVIEHAFRWMVDHADRMPIIGGLAINLSGISLNEDGFADFVLALAKQIGVPMEKVCFEITETAGIANLSNASEFILALKKTGCMFSLDDFGSGHSSYAYLKNLPVDFLKIDGVFIKNMDQNPYDYAVVKSITEIGHFMGKRIIAEYVETEAVLKLLREIGVDFAQGHIIAKPQSLKRLT